MISMLGKELWFLIGLYFSLKKLLNRFPLIKIVATNSLSTRRVCIKWGASWAEEGRGMAINNQGGHQHFMDGSIMKSCFRFTLSSHPMFILNQPKITNSRYLLASLLLAACVGYKESPSIPLATPDNLEPILLLCSVADQHQKQKDEIQDSPCVPHSWIKPGTSHLVTSPYLPPFPPCHLTTLAPFPPCHLFTTCPSPPPHPPFPTRHVTTLQPPQPCHLFTTCPSHPPHPPHPPFPTRHVTTLQPLQPCLLTIFPPFLPFPPS